MQQISSLQNSLVKHLFALTQKSKQRKAHQEFLIEGIREISLAIEGQYVVKQIFFTPSLLDASKARVLFGAYYLTEISLEVYQKLAYRETTEGVLALVQTKSLSLEKLHFEKKNPLLLIAEAPEKPGNIGALLRTADAAGVDAVCIANPKTDLYNPNVIRSSVGTLFTVPIATASTQELLSFLKEKDFAIYCAALTASVPYDSVSYRGRTAIVVGTEDVGLSVDWLHASTQNIIIPMQGKIDSMNVSVSAAVIVFEATRQRKQPQ